MITEKPIDLKIQAEVRSIVHDRTGIDILKDPLLCEEIIVVENINNITTSPIPSSHKTSSYIHELAGEAHFIFQYGDNLYQIFTTFNDGHKKECQVVMVKENSEAKLVDDIYLKTILQLHYIKELAKGDGIDDLSEENRKRLINKLLDFVAPIESLEREKDVQIILEYISQIYGEDFESISWINNKYQTSFSFPPQFPEEKYHRFWYNISDRLVSFAMYWDLDVKNFKNSQTPNVSDNISLTTISSYDMYLLAFRNSIRTMLNRGFTVSQIVDLFDVMVFRYRKA